MPSPHSLARRSAAILGLCALCFCVLRLFASAGAAKTSDGEWPNYGRDGGGQRFSPLTEINPGNVKALHIAWTYRTGDAYTPKSSRPTSFEATPLYVDGVLFLSTPLGRTLALNPTTGQALWSYDSHIDKDAGWGDYANRGVSTWKGPSSSRRVYMATIDARLIALDAKTGKPCKDFGDNGTVNLRQGLRIAPDWPGEYEETSPVAVAGRTLVVGSAVADNNRANAASGEVRGFDAVTGKLLWTFDPIPQTTPGHHVDTAAARTWQEGSPQQTGAANAWSVIAVDPKGDTVYVPTGSASPDYFGGQRKGNNLYANCIVALNAATGEVRWSFQTVHHDLWDYDVASPPLLFDTASGVPAIAVGSKTANLFILNRNTGQPLFPVAERPVPATDIPGEQSSPTQPFPSKPAPVSPQNITAADAWGIADEDRNWCRAEMQKLRAGGVFTPPSLQGSLIAPGYVGGMAWGGMAYDASHDLLLVPANRFVAEVKLIPRERYEAEAKAGRTLGGHWEFAEQRGTPYGMARRFLVGPKGYPCIAPPWGTLQAIRASTGDKLWEVPLGRIGPFVNVSGGKQFPGSIALGGPIVTAAGLVFMAGTPDGFIRAFDVNTGQQLWEAELPSAARATPMTYQGPNGRQYLVISAGGFDIPGTPALGDYVVAFKL